MPRRPKLPEGLGLYWHPKTGIICTRFWVRGQELRRSCKTRDPEVAAVEAKRRHVEAQEDPDVGRRTGRAVTVDELAVDHILEHEKAGYNDLYMSRLRSKCAVVTRNLDRVLRPELQRDAEPGDITYDRWRLYEGHRREGFYGTIRWTHTFKDGTTVDREREGWVDRPARGQTIVREKRLLVAWLERAKRDGAIRELPELPEKIKRNAKDKRRAGKLWPPKLVVSFLSKLHQDAYDEDLVCTLTGLRAFELKRVEATWLEPAPAGADTPAILRPPDEATKGRESRAVGCPQLALDVIKRRLEADPKRVKVFSQSDFRKHRETVARELGFPAPPSKRDLRHTFASLALRRTGRPIDVMRALGHKNLKTTELYLSTTLEDIATTGAAVESALLEVPQPDHQHRITDGAGVEETRATPRNRLERATGLEPATFSLEVREPSNTWLQSLANAIAEERARTAADVAKPDHHTGSPAKRRA